MIRSMATTGAAYFQDNDAAGNSLIALLISEYNGTLSDLVKTSTGGKGLAGLIAVSQDLVVVDGDVSSPVSFSLFRAWGLTVCSFTSRSMQRQHVLPLYN